MKHDVTLDVLDVVGEGDSEFLELGVVVGAEREEARLVHPATEATAFEASAEPEASAADRLAAETIELAAHQPVAVLDVSDRLELDDPLCRVER